MSRASNSEIAALIEWLCLAFATIIKLVRDGARNIADLEPLKKVMQDLITDPSTGKWPVWKTVQLGIGPKTGKDFVKAIETAGGKISDCAKDIMDKPAFLVSDELTGVNLILATVKELTGKDSATTAEVFAGAAYHALEKCSPEIGPQLIRSQYQYPDPDQPKNEWLYIGMEPIADSNGYLEVFRVNHDGNGLWLNADDAYPGRHWLGDSRFVFVRHK